MMSYLPKLACVGADQADPQVRANRYPIVAAHHQNDRPMLHIDCGQALEMRIVANFAEDGLPGIRQVFTDREAVQHRSVKIVAGVEMLFAILAGEPQLAVAVRQALGREFSEGREITPYPSSHTAIGNFPPIMLANPPDETSPPDLEETKNSRPERS